MNETIKTVIAEWLEDERKEYVSVAVRLGIPLSVQETTFVARNIRADGAEFSDEMASSSSFADPGLGSTLAMAREETDGSSQLARTLIGTYAGRCHVYSPMVRLKFEDEPEKWVEQNLLARVGSDYLNGLDSLDSPNLAMADDLAGGLLELIEGDDVVFVTAFPIAGIELDVDSVELDDLLIRRLTPEELGDLAQLRLGFLGRRAGRVHPRFPDVASERWVVEVRVRCPKTQQPMSGYRPHSIVLALQLLGFELHGNGHATTWTEPGPPIWTGGQGFKVSSRGDTRRCSEEDLERALRLAPLIPEEVFSGPTRPQHVALRRFQLGAVDALAEDALIDFVIALEAFLLPEDPGGEYRFKFGLFGAHYLATGTAERRDMFRKLKNVYDVRSKIVHGVRPHDGEELKAAMSDARGLAAGMFVKALEGEWPSPQVLQTAVVEE